MAETNTNGNGNGNSFKSTVSTLLEGMDGFLSSKTVVGDPIRLGDTVILPLTDVSFGMGAGAFAGEKKRNNGGGIAAKISPSAVLVVSEGSVRMVSVKNQDGIAKILDMVPDFVNGFMAKSEARKNPEKAARKEEARAEAAEELKDLLELEE